MPWHIQAVELTGDEPFLHIRDPKVHLNLEVDLLEREVHIYIGGSEPDLARLWVVMDVHGVEVERAVGHTKKDMAIINDVLWSLRCHQTERERVLGPFWALARGSLNQDHNGNGNGRNGNGHHQRRNGRNHNPQRHNPA